MKVKSYSTEAGVKSALNRAGLKNVPHRIHYYDAAGSKGYTATFTVDSVEDRDYLNSKGFMAEIQQGDA